jgi:hypothetical protein
LGEDILNPGTVYIDGKPVGKIKEFSSIGETKEISLKSENQQQKEIKRELNFTIDSASINKYNMYQLLGYRIVPYSFTKKAQKRKHKQKRINKKWLKKYGYIEVPDITTIYIMDRNIIAHPKTIEIMKKYVNK